MEAIVTMESKTSIEQFIGGMEAAINRSIINIFLSPFIFRLSFAVRPFMVGDIKSSKVENKLWYYV